MTTPETNACPNVAAPPVALPIGLALSGGGLRAMLFHLGVIRYLYECVNKDVEGHPSLLSQVTKICSASGGSLLAADLVQHWDQYICPPSQRHSSRDPFEVRAEHIVKLAQADIRNRLVRRRLISPLLLLLNRFHLRTSTVSWGSSGLFQHYLDTYLYDFATMNSLSRRSTLPFHALAPATAPLSCPSPDIFLIATSIDNASIAAFTESVVHYNFSTYGHLGDPKVAPCAAMPISAAVAASAAFPAFFNPIPITKSLRNAPANELPSTRFVDGGVADNLAMRTMDFACTPEHLFSKNAQVHKGEMPEIVIASDAELPFREQHRVPWYPGGAAIRAVDLLTFRIDELETEARHYFETIARVKDPIFVRSEHEFDTSKDKEYCLPAPIRHPIPFLRTDLDHFSIMEISCLVQHGYYAAQSALRTATKRHPALAAWLPVEPRFAWDPFARRFSSNWEAQQPPPGSASGPAPAIAEQANTRIVNFIGGRKLSDRDIDSVGRALQRGATRKIWRRLIIPKGDGWGGVLLLLQVAIAMCLLLLGHYLLEILCDWTSMGVRSLWSSLVQWLPRAPAS